MENNLLYDSTERLVSETFDRESVRRGSAGEWCGDAWRRLEEAGIPMALVPEAQGGFGFALAEAADILRLVGYWAVPLPLSETMLAAALLARVGLALPEGVLTIAPPRRTSARLVREGDDWRITGDSTRVPWARHAETVVVLADDHLVALPVSSCELTQGANLAGEPRDDLRFDCPVSSLAPAGEFDAGRIHAAGAALRTIMIAGAANRVLDLSVEYACEHHQFGRPIAKFQAVQQNLAIIGGQAAVCRASGDMAAQALFALGGALAIAMAKARAGEAASEAAHLGHQVHGAIGFTDEYDLQLYTKRIWAWRDEFGNEAEWNEVVGQAALDEPAGPWALITSQAGQL